MSRIADKAYEASTELRLWFKQQSNGTLMLTDVSQIIPLRWDYFRDNWEFIKNSLEKRVENYQFPNLLRAQIEEFSDFIRKRRNIVNRNINPFSDSGIVLRFYAIFDNVEVSSIQLTKEEEIIANNAVKKVNAFTRTDFERIREDIVAAREEISDIAGASDSDYNRVVRRSSVSAQRDINLKDILNQQQYMQSVRALDYIIANAFSLDTVTVDPFALARQNANNPDIDIQTGVSGRLVRMNYGENLESLAGRFLGDRDRWIEIAIANGLRPPYVDEVGSTLPLLSNGSGTQVSLSAQDSNGDLNKEKFYVGQVIFLQSDTVVIPDQRSIISIKEVPVSGELILEVDGDPDLDRFKINENSFLKVFTVNTINSNFFVLIPSEQPLSNSVQGDIPFFLRDSAEDEKQAGVDLLLNDDKDLVFTSFDDLGINFGVSNALQAMQLKIEIEKGALVQHPDFGLIGTIGQKNSNIDQTKQQVIDDLEGAINADPRFDRIERLDVKYDNENASAIYVQIAVRLSGTGTVVPITFTLNKG